MALPTILSNQPSAGSISWSSFGIQYDGVGHDIPAGSTDKKFTWWDYDGNIFAPGESLDPGEWGVSSGADGGTFSVVTDPLGDGIPAFLMQNPTRRSAGPVQVVPEAQYTIEIDACGEGILFGLIPSASTTSWIGGNATTTPSPGEWTTFSKTVTIPSGVTQVWVRMAYVSTGDAYVKAIRVYQGSGSAIRSADTLPELAPEDLLLFLNRNGVGVLAPTAQVVDGSLIVSGSIIGDAIAANQIDAYHVKAGAITANAIAAGAVQAEALAAGVITTSKLSVGTISDNAVANGSFEDGTEGWTSIAAGAGASADVVTGVASAGSNALRLVRGTSDTDLSIGQHPDFFIPVSSAALRRWYINARAGAASALAAGFNLIAYWWQADKTTPSAISPATAIATDEALSTSWSDFEGQVTVPSDAHWMQIAIVNSLSGSTMFVDEVTALEVVVSAMIGDGEISAAKLAAGSVEAEAIAAGAVSAGAIAAGAIQANHIEAGSINVSHLSPSVGENLDLSANGSITSLAGQVNLIATDVGDTADQVSSMATALVVTPTNVQIVNSNSSYSFVITPEGAQITEGGVARASWDAGRMVVPSMVVDGAIIGNHKWEKSGSGTIVRAL